MPTGRFHYYDGRFYDTESEGVSAKDATPNRDPKLHYYDGKLYDTVNEGVLVKDAPPHYSR